ncbi:MAG: hypothetical protein ACRDYV_02175 [Acidimicrobiia bacterium]
MANFKLNPHFAEEVLRARFVKEKLEGLVEEGAARYPDGVPVDEGDLRDSIFGDVALTETGFKGRIGATDWKAAIVEFGTSRSKADGSLRRAVESLGIEFETKEGR